MRWYKTPWFVRAMYPNCHFSKQNSAGIYLTFDDGPDPKATPWVLDLLDQSAAKATFFVVGRLIQENPDILERAIHAEHTVGNHTFSHLKGWSTGTRAYISDVHQMQGQLEKLGANRKLFRPPYGKLKKKQLALLEDYETFFWSHLSWDFDHEIKPEVSIRKLKNVPPGSIILFHDTQQAFQNLKQILPELISHYQDRNLKLLAL